MSVTGVAGLPCVGDAGRPIVELRREAVSAVVRTRQLDGEAAAVRARAARIEEEARRAFARGEDRLGRQILFRGLFTLETRERLEQELGESRRLVVQLLQSLVRTENQAWGVRMR